MENVRELIGLIKLSFALLLVSVAPQACVLATAAAPEASHLDVLEELEGFGERTVGDEKGEAIMVTNLMVDTFTEAFEAESAKVKSTFTIETDAGASAGSYLAQPSSVKNSRNPGEEATLSFEVPSDGSYTMWARLYGPSDATDAIYLGFDSTLHRKFPDTHGTYQWVKVTAQRLKAGSHRVSLGHGEAGARIDMVVVSSEALSTKALDSFVEASPRSESKLASAPQSEPEPEPTQQVSYLDILGELEGFGKNTTGGKNGEVVVVTNLGSSGAGSLREAVSMNGPKWVVFKEGLRGTINLSSNLYVKSDKTIDGRGADITLGGRTLVVRSDNVIVTHLKFKGSDNDAIRVQDKAKNVWIHRNSLQRSGDGLIDVRRGATDITVSWNKFSNHGLAMLLGAECSEGDDNMRVTLHHNYFNAMGERSPKVNCGKVHTYNNYNYRWRHVAAKVEKGGEIYSEANIYEAGSEKRASTYSGAGYLRSVNDLMQKGAFHHTKGANNVFKPSSFYSYKADKADAKLKSAVSTRAGWQSILRSLDLQSTLADHE